MKNNNCDFCGLSFREIHEQNRFGCARCYEIFADRLPEIMEPPRPEYNTPDNEPRRDRKEMRKKIEEELSRAVALEEYELAAELRDQLRENDQTNIAR